MWMVNRALCAPTTYYLHCDVVRVLEHIVQRTHEVFASFPGSCSATSNGGCGSFSGAECDAQRVALFPQDVRGLFGFGFGLICDGDDLTEQLATLFLGDSVDSKGLESDESQILGQDLATKAATNV